MNILEVRKSQWEESSSLEKAVIVLFLAIAIPGVGFVIWGMINIISRWPKG